MFSENAQKRQKAYFMRKNPKNPCFYENSTPSPPPSIFSDRLRGVKPPQAPKPMYVCNPAFDNMFMCFYIMI